MSSSGGGPGGNKWVWFNTAGLSGEEIGRKLNDLANLGFYEQTILIQATDGVYLYVGGYSS